MEIVHWGDCKECYAATTYWYALPGATSNRLPQPEEAVRPIHEQVLTYRIDHAVECEGMKIVAKSPDLATVVQSVGGLEGDWSEGRAVIRAWPSRRRFRRALFSRQREEHTGAVRDQELGLRHLAFQRQRPAPAPTTTLGPRGHRPVARFRWACSSRKTVDLSCVSKWLVPIRNRRTANPSSASMRSLLPRHNDKTRNKHVQEYDETRNAGGD